MNYDVRKLKKKSSTMIKNILKNDCLPNSFDATNILLIFLNYEIVFFYFAFNA